MNSASPDPRLNRQVWKIDALRGFLILSVLIGHLTLTVNALVDEDDGDKTITLNLEKTADAHINLAFDAIRSLIGSAVNE